MKAYKELEEKELLALKEDLDREYEKAKAKGLKLDMSRGKASVSQLNMEMDFLDIVNSSTNIKTETGVDCRNYGLLDGIPEAKRLVADMIGVSEDMIIVFGNEIIRRK